jgi:predicted double-glycine peptidase
MTRWPLGAAMALGVALASPAAAQISLGGGLYSMKVTSMRDIPFRTVVRQQYDYSCGSAALATLLHHHYGLAVTEAEVFEAMYEKGDQAKIREVGFSLLDMKRYLESRGMAADGYRATVAQLERAKAPALAVISVGAYRHFVVIKGVKDGRVLVGDPALGLKAYDEAEFLKVWNGIVFAVHEAPGIKAAYNRAEEWAPWATAPLGRPLSEGSLSAFTRELPPLYQVVSPLQLTGNLR